MSIRLQDMRLFIVKDEQPIKIELKQKDDILFNLVTKADRSPINILVPVIEGNQPITIKVNDNEAQILPDNLEMQQTYKLLLQNGYCQFNQKNLNQIIFNLINLNITKLYNNLIKNLSNLEMFLHYHLKFEVVIQTHKELQVILH